MQTSLEEFSKRLGMYLAYRQIKTPNKFGEYLGYGSGEKISRLFRDVKNKPSAEILYDIAVKCPDLNPEWLLTGHGEMLRKSADSSHIPYYTNVEAFGNSHLDGVGAVAYPTGHVQIPGITNADGAIQVYGNSMAPTFNNGDLLVVKKVTDICEYPNRQPAVVVMDSGTVYVKIMHVSSSSIQLLSVDYTHEPLTFAMKQVRAVFRIVARIERFGV